jgi:hypothetical protein
MTEYTGPQPPEYIVTTRDDASAGLDSGESGNEPIDHEAVRRRFPWVGLGESGEHGLSTRYREIMAAARKTREIVEAVGQVRRSE